MDSTQIYAIGVGAVFVSLILVNKFISSCVKPKPFMKTISVLARRYFAYPELIRRHRYLGPWSPADVVMQLSYVAVNVFCLKTTSVQMAGLRAGTLSLVNMIPLLASLHISFIADILGIRLASYQRIHRLAGIMSSFLLVLHVLTVFTSRTAFPLHVVENLWGLIVSFTDS
jgi:hypothetical protein